LEEALVDSGACLNDILAQIANWLGLKPKLVIAIIKTADGRKKNVSKIESTFEKFEFLFVVYGLLVIWLL
jgi:hypothetical protein